MAKVSHAQRIHGIEGVAWDDYRLPVWMWSRLTRTDGGCWLLNDKTVNPQVAIARRILALPRDRILGAVATCGHPLCANPAHICVTEVRE